MKDKMQLEMLLKMLGLKTMLRNYEQFADKAQKQKLTYSEFLYQLAQVEADDKRNRKVGRLLKSSQLPEGKSLESFDITGQPALSKSLLRELASGDCLDRCESILVFGVPGTGKSHLSAALGREWCLRGRKVLWTTTAALVQDLLAAKRDLELNELIDKLDGFEALIIDDISYVPQTKEESDVLFVLLAKRYETRSVVITSNLVFSAWENIFKDKMTTKAAIDRLVHHGTILELVEIEGESWRERAAKLKQKGAAATKTTLATAK